MQYTQTKRDAVISRDLESRLGEGGIRQFVSHVVRHLGQQGWGCIMTYSDGTTTTVTGPGSSRIVPTLA